MTPEELARQQDRQEQSADLAAAAVMLARWREAMDAAMAALAVLQGQVRRARLAGVPVDRAWLARQDRLARVVPVARASLLGYAATANNVIQGRQADAVRAGLANAEALVEAALADAPPDVLDLRTPDQRNLDNLVGRMSDGSPLPDHLRATVAEDAAEALEEVLAKSLADGLNPVQVAEKFAQEMALPHTRAVTILRTEALGILRETSRQVYDANPDVVRSWTWLSALDLRTCPACAVMHGTKHPTTETLDGHPRCRCSMVPNTVTYAELGITGVDDPPPVPLGVDWIAAMPADVRRTYLGPAKFAALEDGQITLLDLVARRYDPRWGSMRTERSLVSIREGRNANYGGLNGELGPTPKNVPANS